MWPSGVSRPQGRCRVVSFEVWRGGGNRATIKDGEPGRSMMRDNSAWFLLKGVEYANTS